MFDNESVMICSGTFNISEIKDSKISGKFNIHESYYNDVSVGSGEISGLENADRSKADITFMLMTKENSIKINLNSTWNLLKGNWSASLKAGKFIAFEKKSTF